MSTYLVVFYLKKPPQDYETLLTAIKAVGPAKHFSGSTWFIKSRLSDRQLWKHLRKYIYENDSLLVAKIGSAVW